MASETQKFDAVVVGAGQAGPPLAGRLTAAGQTVAVIERKLIGGTCVNTGCIPTKTLVASAHAAHLARRGAEYGVGTGDVTVDMAKVKARKDKVMLDDRHGVESWLDGMDGCTLIRGHARFESPHTIRVDGQVLEADKIFLNLGGRAVAPDLPGLSDIDYLTNVSILELDSRARTSRHHRRQLHRAGVRADVPPIRRAHQRDREGSAAGVAGGRGRLGRNQRDPGGRGHRCSCRCDRHPIRQARQRFRGDSARREQRRSRAPTC